jgi:hypothetical protein
MEFPVLSPPRDASNPADFGDGSRHMKKRIQESRNTISSIEPSGRPKTAKDDIEAAL